jgi:hypothetical protein
MWFNRETPRREAPVYVDDIKQGKPLAQLPEEPPEGQRLVQLNFLMPWKQAREFRQIVREKNSTASRELRMMVDRWIREQKESSDG